MRFYSFKQISHTHIGEIEVLIEKMSRAVLVAVAKDLQTIFLRSVCNNA